MASVSTYRRGRKRVTFTDADGKHRALWLGECSKAHAQAVRVHVERLIAAQLTGHPASSETLKWLERCGSRMREKLSRCGLVKRREDRTLGACIEEYIAGRMDVKESTRARYARARKDLLWRFGADRIVRTMAPEEIRAWREALLLKGLGENTVRKTCGIARQFFSYAVKHGWMETNPVVGVPVSVRGNSEKLYFVSRQETEAVLAHCSDLNPQLIFALARYGGLRVPSEVLSLRLCDIDWERDAIRVRSPKTEHHAGHESREMPIFEELRPFVEARVRLGGNATDWVVECQNRSGVNWRTQFVRIIRRAGLEPWPKLFQNLRSTRVTEVAEGYGRKAAAEWMGHSEEVAME